MHVFIEKRTISIFANNILDLFTKVNQIMAFIQVNEYQADLYLVELIHQMTNVCLFISYFLPTFDCSCMLGT